MFVVSKVSSLRSLRFVKTRQLSTSELKGLYLLHDRIAQLLTESLATEPAAAAHWQVIAIEQVTFGDLLNKFPRDTVWSILSFGESLVGGVMLIMEKDTAISFVRQGGAGMIGQEGELTEHELGMIDARFQQFSEAFGAIWGEYHPLSTQLATFPNTPSLDEFHQLLIGLKAETTVALVTFRVTMVARDVLKVMLVFPQPYLEPLLPTVRALAESQRQDADFEQIRDRIEQVEDVTTPVVVELGRATLTFEELQNLTENDFLQLDQRITDPLPVRLGERTVLKGRPGTTPDGKHMAVQINEE